MTLLYFRGLPVEIQILSGVILVMFLGILGWAIVGLIRDGLWFKKAIQTLKQVPPLSVQNRKQGLSLVDYGRLVRLMAPYHDKAWWRGIESSTVEYPVAIAGSEAVGVFISMPPDRIASFDRVVGFPNWHRFFRLLPGVTTSLGLFGTFLALLLGLKGVTVSGETVTGTDVLINNLSGKFFTSVGAILLSVVAVLLEGFVQRTLTNRWTRLVDAIDERLPLLTTNLLMADLRKQSIVQTGHLSALHTTFATEIGNLFRDQVGPAMAQQITASMSHELSGGLNPLLGDLRTSLDLLTQTVSRLEESKQESVVGEVRVLVSSITETLQSTLGTMGDQFRDALGASTQNQFTNLGSVLDKSTTALQEMADSYRSLEAGLQAVVANAQQATVNQMESGTSQTERLHVMVEALVGRLESSASQNVSAVNDALSRAIGGLSSQMTELSESMVASVRASTAETSAASQAALMQAGSWTEQTGMQLAQVLAAMEAKAGLLDTSAQRVLEARQALEQGIQGAAGVLGEFGGAVADIRTASAELSAAQRHATNGQAVQARLMEQTEGLFGQIAMMTSSNGELFDRHQDALAQYQAAHTQLDSDLQRVLAVIGEEMKKYAAEIQRSFEAIVKSSNQYIPEFTEAIKDGTGGVRDGLEELADALEQATKRLGPGAPR